MFKIVSPSSLVLIFFTSFPQSSVGVCRIFLQVTKLVAQGFSADSVDGRQHSAISEAACQVGAYVYEDKTMHEYG